jgi:hypothetical protein
MRYQIEMQHEVWRVRDREWDLTAEFGGIPLEHLTIGEAHVMLGMLEAWERAVMEDTPVATSSADRETAR